MELCPRLWWTDNVGFSHSPKLINLEFYIKIFSLFKNYIALSLNCIARQLVEYHVSYAQKKVTIMFFLYWNWVPMNTYRLFWLMIRWMWCQTMHFFLIAMYSKTLIKIIKDMTFVKNKKILIIKSLLTMIETWTK